MSKFKVGDIVKISRGRSSCSRKYDGKVAAVFRADLGDVYNLDIEADKNWNPRQHNEGGFWEDELTVATGIERQEYYNSRRKAIVSL